MAARKSDADPRDETTPRPVDMDASERKLQDVLATIRNSDIDIRDYTPDMAAILREAHPGRAEEKLLESRLTPLPAGAAPANGGAPARVTDPSPWAKSTDDAGAIDKAALPSAMMPVASREREPDADVPATLVKPPVRKQQRRSRWVAVALGAGAIIAVFAPLTMMYFLLVWRNDNGPSGAGTAATSATNAMPLPSAATASAPSAAVTVAPSVSPTAPSSAAPTLSATAPQAPSPTHAPTGRLKPRTAPDDPYDASSPAPLATIAPVAPAPTQAAPVPSSTASAPFLVRKKEP
jgi:hypothetical protein